VIAEKVVRDDGPYHAAHHHRWKCADGKGAKNFLEGKEGTSERGIEGGRDACRRAGSHQDLGACRIEAKRSPKERCEGSAEHGHGPLTAGRSAASERNRARGGACQRRLQGHSPAVPSDRSLDIRNVEPLVATPGPPHDPPRDRQPQSGQQRPVRDEARSREKAGGPNVEEPVCQIDETVECDRTETACQSYGNGKSEQDGVFAQA
jgi:hypothetical protein